jgi:hypothetical protein
MKKADLEPAMTLFFIYLSLFNDGFLLTQTWSESVIKQMNGKLERIWKEAVLT